MTPEGWEHVRLGDIATLEYGRSLPANRRRSGAVPVYGSNGQVGSHDQAAVHGPGIVVGRKGTIGAVHWIPSDFWPIDTTYFVRATTDSFDLRWMFYRLLGLGLSRLNEGTGLPGLNRNTASELSLALPPLPEQRKIASILSSVDDAIEKTQAVIDQVQMVKKGLMQELLTRGLPGRPTRFKKTEFGQIPEEWEVVPIGNVVEQVRQPVTVQPAVTYREIGVRSHGKGVFHKEPVTGRELGNKRVFWVEPGCIVLNIVFAWERAVAWTSEAEGGMIASHRFPMFKPRVHLADLRFLTHFLQSHAGNQALRSVSPGGAGRNKTLNQSAFLKLHVPLPSLQEQRAIGEANRVVSEREHADARVLRMLNLVKAELMTLLLSGEVRVRPDPEAA